MCITSFTIFVPFNSSSNRAVFDKSNVSFDQRYRMFSRVNPLPVHLLIQCLSLLERENSVANWLNPFNCVKSRQ